MPQVDQVLVVGKVETTRNGDGFQVSSTTRGNARTLSIPSPLPETEFTVAHLEHLRALPGRAPDLANDDDADL